MKDRSIERFDELARRIGPPSGDVQLIAVDGPSGSGKSTFAERLSKHLDVVIIPIDDFVSWDDLESWWSRLEAQVLEPLLRGGPARYQQRDWKDDYLGTALGDWRSVEPTQVVVLEGVTSARQAVADRVAYVVWIDAPAEERLRRGLERDGSGMEQRWLDWMEREQAFFANDRTRERASLKVDGAPTEAHDPDQEFIRAGTHEDAG